jgi:hypothetical protein
VFVTGQEPVDDLDDDGAELETARVVTYSNLLQDARDSYEEYLRNRQEAGRVSRLIEKIGSADFEL